MSRRINKIKLSFWLYSGRKGLRIRSWQRDETRMESLGVKAEKKHG